MKLFYLFIAISFLTACGGSYHPGDSKPSQASAGTAAGPLDIKPKNDGGTNSLTAPAVQMPGKTNTPSAADQAAAQTAAQQAALAAAAADQAAAQKNLSDEIAYEAAATNTANIAEAEHNYYTYAPGIRNALMPLGWDGTPLDDSMNSAIANLPNAGKLEPYNAAILYLLSYADYYEWQADQTYDSVLQQSGNPEAASLSALTIVDTSAGPAYCAAWRISKMRNQYYPMYPVLSNTIWNTVCQ